MISSVDAIAAVCYEANRAWQRELLGGSSCLLTKMKKELQILRDDPQRRKQVPHPHSEMFVVVIDRCGMVGFGR